MASSSVSPNYPTTTDDEAFEELETTLRRQIKDRLDGVTTSYEELDARVQTLEHRLPKNLRYRLKVIDDRLAAQDTINDAQRESSSASSAEHTALQARVNQIETEFNAALTSKLLVIQSQFDQYKRSLERLSEQSPTVQDSDPLIQDLLQRLHKLENQPKSGLTNQYNSGPALDTWSNDQLARKLLNRLDAGQALSSNLAARLHLATAPPPIPTAETLNSAAKSRKRPAPAVSITSSSLLSNVDSIEEDEPAEEDELADEDELAEEDEAMDEDELAEEDEAMEEDEVDEATEQPPTKRLKSPATTTTATRTSPRRISSIWKATKVDVATPAGKNDSSSQPTTTDDREMTAEELELLLQDEPRRSGRARTVARNPQYITWLEVAAAKRRQSST